MTCPICARPTDPKYRPFCSRRCADVDLGRWMTGTYVLPDGPEDAQPDDQDTPPPPATTRRQ
jgi:endogenous inhibitor of DNA gyrase (YacG/DUF329 family)